MVRHHHRVAPVIALALVLAAAAPASARLELNPAAGADNPKSTSASTSLCSEVCSASGYTAQNNGTALPHDPRLRAVALAGAGYGYGSTPIASSVTNGPRSEVVSGFGYSIPIANNGTNGPRSEVVSGARHITPTTLATTVRVVSPENGFDWGDAGIGAGGAVALMTLIVGGTLGVTSARRRATRNAA